MIAQLKAAGLSESEAKIYLALLELGPSSVQQVSAKAGISRPTTYLQIEILKKKDLVTSQIKGKKILFIAESPDNLSALLLKESAELEARRAELAHVLPDLRAAHSLTDEKPVVRYFEGKAGLIAARQEVLRCKEKMIRSIAHLEQTFAVFPRARTGHTSDRVKRGIRSKFIYSTSQGPILKNTDAQNLRESRYVAPERLPLSFDFAIFDDKVKFEILRGRLGGIIIQNKDIAQSFKNLFDFVWGSIKE